MVNIIFLLILIFIGLEILFYFLLQKTFLYKKSYFKPHIFVNFISRDGFSDSKIKINENNFRDTFVNSNENNFTNLYLLGCCNFFEGHLKTEDTFAHLLDEKLTNCKVLNPSMTHYTLYHMLNRFLLDLKRNQKIDFLINSSTVNDVLVFIHHQNGKYSKDHSHYYKTFLDIEKYSFVKKIPFNILKFIVLFLNAGSLKKLLNYETHFYNMNKNFEKNSNHTIAKSLINFSDIPRYLDTLLAICKRLNIELILSTFSYNPKDFEYGIRKTYLHGIEQINQIYREYALKNKIPLLDFEKNVKFNTDDIDNKWHFSKSGNEKRANFVKEFLKKKYNGIK